MVEADELMLIWTSVLLEKKIIFVSDDLGTLSSAIFGFLSLIEPFKWCFPAYPILSDDLLEVLEAPMPLMVGLTTNQATIAGFEKKEHNKIRRKASFSE